MALQVLVLTAGLSSTVAQDSGAAAVPLQIEVQQLSVQNTTSGSLRHLSGRINLQVQVTNRSARELRLATSQIRLLCGGRPAARSASGQAPLIPDPGLVLVSDEQQSGWLSFRVAERTSEEVDLHLQWNVAGAELDIDLNQRLRELIDLQVDQVGYQQRLTVLKPQRPLDLFTIWVLSEKLRELRTDQVERVVVDVQGHREARLDSDIAGWLLQASRSIVQPRRPFRNGYPAPPRFLEFHVSGQAGRGQHSELMFHAHRTMAVAAAMDSLYRRLPVAEALNDLSSPDAGIRLAVLDSSLDRLTEQQLLPLLDDVKRQDGSLRRQVLPLLDRVSHPAAVELLEHLLVRHLQVPPTAAESLPPDVATTIARTLVRCSGPSAEASVRQVWQLVADAPLLRDALVKQMVVDHDHRWLPTLMEYAEHQLQLCCRQADNKPDGDPVQSAPAAVSHLIPEVLQFFLRNPETFRPVARRYVAVAGTPKIQDGLLEFLLTSPVPADRQLAVTCVDQRVNRQEITRDLINAVHRMPQDKWTEALLELSRDPRYRPLREQLAQAAIRCANQSQMDRILDQLDTLNDPGRARLFQQMAVLNHPRRAELLEKSLQAGNTQARIAIRYLVTEDAPELTRILAEHYDVILQQAQQSGKLDTVARGLAQQLLFRLTRSDLPDARRRINRTSISPAEELRALLREQSQLRPMAARKARMIWDLRRKNQHQQALETADSLIAADPLYVDYRLVRASLLLRNDRIRPALEDLQVADRLSPENVITESTLALAMVRLGQIEEGLAAAETVLQRVPDQAGIYYAWTLYNTACVYSRTLQQSQLPAEQQESTRERAMELLARSAAAGVYDQDHVLGDPDLVPLHEDERWQAVIDRITANDAPRNR